MVKTTTILSNFVETYWGDLSRVWKASTAKRNWNAWKIAIAPVFGAMRLADILPADIHRSGTIVRVRGRAVARPCQPPVNCPHAPLDDEQLLDAAQQIGEAVERLMG